MWVQATAFAEAVASAATCDCAVAVSSEVSGLEEIWVEAATNAYAETCSCTPPPLAAPLLPAMQLYVA